MGSGCLPRDTNAHNPGSDINIVCCCQFDVILMSPLIETKTVAIHLIRYQQLHFFVFYIQEIQQYHLFLDNDFV